MSRKKLDRSETGFVVFKAKRHGVSGAMGSSVLHRGWTDDEVLRQLLVDGCPIGTEVNNLPQVIGWPADSFKVKTSQGTVYFKAEGVDSIVNTRRR